MTGVPDLTRRQALQAGAGGAALLLTATAVPTFAAAADATVDPLLRRSAWTGFIGAGVDIAGAAARLDAVDDLRGAAARGLEGSDDAFVLRLSGPAAAPLEQGTHNLRRADGTGIALLVTPVGPAGGTQAYEVVVDRSMAGVTAPVPPPAEPVVAAPPAVADTAVAPDPRYRALTSVVVRRVRPGLQVRLAFRRTARLRTVSVQVARGGVVLAHGRAEAQARHALVGLRLRAPVPRGRYDLIIRTADRDGTVTVVRRQLLIR